MPLWVKPLVLAVLSVGAIHAVVQKNRDKIDFFVMGIIRDIGRYKARKRRFKDDTALTTLLFRRDDPMQDMVDAEDEDELDLPTYTEAELLEFGDGLDGRPILLGVLGRVYDVSKGEKFYGPGAPYGMFAGRDVTYSLSTACRTPDCVEAGADGIDELGEGQLGEGKRWLSFFHLHDKYPLVGKLETDYLETILEKDLKALEEEMANGNGEPLKPPILAQ